MAQPSELTTAQRGDLSGQISFARDRDLFGQYRNDLDTGGERLSEFPADPVEVGTGRNGLAIQENPVLPEPPCQLVVEQGTVAVAILAPVADEHGPIHHATPKPRRSPPRVVGRCKGVTPHRCRHRSDADMSISACSGGRAVAAARGVVLAG